MFEISQLKEKKLSDLQEIAQKLNVPKYRTLKKEDLVYQILDLQAANPDTIKNELVKEEAPKPKTQQVKPKRERIEKKAPEKKDQQKIEFSEPKKEEGVQSKKDENTSDPCPGRTPFHLARLDLRPGSFQRHRAHAAG